MHLLQVEDVQNLSYRYASFEQVHFRFSGLKKMNIKLNSIIHYQFSSCLRQNLLVKTSIRYPKTAQKVLRDAGTSCRRTRYSKKITPNSIAACVRKKGDIDRLDCERRVKKITYRGDAT